MENEHLTEVEAKAQLFDHFCLSFSELIEVEFENKTSKKAAGIEIYQYVLLALQRSIGAGVIYLASVEDDGKIKDISHSAVGNNLPENSFIPVSHAIIGKMLENKFEQYVPSKQDLKTSLATFENGLAFSHRFMGVSYFIICYNFTRVYSLGVFFTGDHISLVKAIFSLVLIYIYDLRKLAPTDNIIGIIQSTLLGIPQKIHFTEGMMVSADCSFIGGNETLYQAGYRKRTGIDAISMIGLFPPSFCYSEYIEHPEGEIAGMDETLHPLTLMIDKLGYFNPTRLKDYLLENRINLEPEQQRLVDKLVEAGSLREYFFLPENADIQVSELVEGFGPFFEQIGRIHYKFKSVDQSLLMEYIADPKNQTNAQKFGCVTQLGKAKNVEDLIVEIIGKYGIPAARLIIEILKELEDEGVIELIPRIYKDEEPPC